MAVSIGSFFQIQVLTKDTHGWIVNERRQLKEEAGRERK
jgi:hypothetical protein